MRHIFIGLACISLALGAAACSGNAESSEDTSSDDDALTSGSRSGFAECTGFGWTNSITDWKGVRGSYIRSGLSLAAGHDMTTLRTSENPSERNEGAPAYSRTIDNHVDTGRIILGVDNPAIDPVIGFRDASLTEFKGIYWTLSQQKGISGKIRGICLMKGAEADGSPAQNSKPFMLSRVGL